MTNTQQQDQTKSLSDKVFDLLDAGDVGTIVTYEDLKAVGCDVRKSRAPVYRAARLLLKTRGLPVVVVKTVGYQIVSPNEAPSLMRKRIVQGEKQVRLGVRLGGEVDRERMAPAQRDKVDALLACAVGLQKSMRDVIRRQEFQARILAQHDQQIAEIRESQQREVRLSAEEVAAFREMMRQRAGS